MLEIDYRVAMPQPQSHRFQVTVTVRGWQGQQATFGLPVWTPGSYLVREFARHVEGFRAASSAGTPLPWRRSRKDCWQVEAAGVAEFAIHFEVYANELTVRTSHLDESHGYFNGTNLLPYLIGHTEQPLGLEVLPPAGWHVSIALPQGANGHYQAQSYDQLVDSPAEIGTHRRLFFEALGKRHEIALWGHGNEDEAALRRDFRYIVEQVAALFGSELPYERYLFIVHLGDRLGGGLEHRDSTTLQVDRWGFEPRSEYDKVLRLALHEFFHVWLVKRIRPHNLGPFDYSQEVYSPLLWVMEGFTTYYDLLLLRRSALISTARFLEMLGERIASYLQQPGRLVQSLEESSLTAWIKFYRQDENYPNSAISYYLKGSLVALMLDLELRAASRNEQSLDSLLRLLWQRFGQRDVGFTEEEFFALARHMGGDEVERMLVRAVRDTDELPLEHYLALAGLHLERRWRDGQSPPWSGLTLRSEGGQLLLKSVLRDSPAERAGLIAGDQLVALNGYALRDEPFLHARLREHQAGDVVTFHLFRYGQLLERRVTLGAAPPDQAVLSVTEEPTPLQRALLRDWLGS